MKSTKHASSVFNHLSFADGKIRRDTVVELKDFNASSIYIPLHNEYYLVFPYEIIGSKDRMDDLLLYEVKWEDVKNANKEIEEYNIITSSPLDVKKAVYPLKRHRTIEDFVDYLNELIDEDELID
jgi:hypothetical protein